MDLEKEVEQYEQQLAEVRLELKDQPEELKLVEAEVRDLINDLKRQINAQKNETNVDINKATGIKPDDKNPETHDKNLEPTVSMRPKSAAAEIPKAMSTKKKNSDGNPINGISEPAKPDPYETNRSKWKSFSGRVTKRKYNN